VTLFVAPRLRFDIASRRLTDDLREEGLLHIDEEVRLLRRYVVVGGGEVFAPATRTVDPSGAAPDAISPAVPLVFADPAEERILSRP
jgi:siroheme synthase (precorrin-2 oxidase/ferrochelatase)